MEAVQPVQRARVPHQGSQVLGWSGNQNGIEIQIVETKKKLQQWSMELFSFEFSNILQNVPVSHDYFSCVMLLERPKPNFFLFQ